MMEGAKVTNAETLAEIRALAEGMTVACDHSALFPGDLEHCGGTENCNGTGRLPDPAYAALLNVARMECECCREQCYCPEVTALQMRLGGHDDGGADRCVPCQGIDYVASDLSGWPEGALAGGLGKVAMQMCQLPDMGVAWMPIWFRVASVCWKFDDLAAAEAMLEAMVVMKGEKNDHILRR